MKLINEITAAIVKNAKDGEAIHTLAERIGFAYSAVYKWISILENYDVIHLVRQGNKNIIRIGFVEEDDLVGLYNIASVFIMPSLYEGFGLPVLEAMSCGCPVITSKEGSLTEVAGDAVCYIDATNLKDIANSLRKVFYEKNLQEELSRKGLLQSKKFSWKKTTDFTVETYRKALE